MSACRVSSTLQSVSSVLFSVSLSVWFEWKLGLVVTVYVPWLILSSWLQAKIMAGHFSAFRTHQENASQVSVIPSKKGCIFHFPLAAALSPFLWRFATNQIQGWETNEGLTFLPSPTLSTTTPCKRARSTDHIMAII